ncbi:MAG: GAF domain-containing protein [Magnetovibrionaceae bacterium]
MAKRANLLKDRRGGSRRNEDRRRPGGRRSEDEGHNLTNALSAITVKRDNKPRLVALVELTLFISLALLGDFLFGAGERFIDFQPHPFWLIVLLLSIQYGTTEGLFAAFVASIALLAGNLPEQRVDQDLYTYLFDIGLTPILWVVAAVLFGELRVRQIMERDQLRADLSAAIERETVLDRRYRELRAVKSRLEERVAGQLKTVLSTYQAAKALEARGVGRVLLGMSNLIEAILGPQKHSVFLLKGKHLQAVSGRGWTPEDAFRRDFDERDELFRIVIGRQEVVTVADPQGEEIMDGQGIIAGPLVDKETGEVMGMLKIEELSFLDFNMTTVENFRILCDWLAAAHANARAYERAEQQIAFNPEINMMTSNIYERLTTILRSIAQRVGFDISVILVRLDGADGLSGSEKREVTRLLGESVQTVLRHTDVVFNRKQREYDHTLVLPNTPRAGSEIVARKLSSEFAKRMSSRGLTVDIKFAFEQLYRHDGSTNQQRNPAPGQQKQGTQTQPPQAQGKQVQGKQVHGRS